MRCAGPAFRWRLDDRDQVNQAAFRPRGGAANVLCLSIMAMTADQLPNDPIALKAMVLAREAENERLRQIIKEL